MKRQRGSENFSRGLSPVVDESKKTSMEKCCHNKWAGLVKTMPKIILLQKKSVLTTLLQYYLMLLR